MCGLAALNNSSAPERASRPRSLCAHLRVTTRARVHMYNTYMHMLIHHAHSPCSFMATARANFNFVGGETREGAGEGSSAERSLEKARKFARWLPRAALQDFYRAETFTARAGICMQTRSHPFFASRVFPATRVEVTIIFHVVRCVSPSNPADF